MSDCMKNPLVVGYRGEIGSFILHGLLRVMPKALNVWCFDVNETETEKIRRIRKSDVVFLCVPMSETLGWLRKYKKYLKGKIVIEQTSLKGWISKLRCQGFTMLSMHILFRPSATPDPAERRIVMIEHPLWGLYGEIVLKIIDAALVTDIKDCSTHDVIMAFQQALVHRVLLVLSNIIDDFPCATYVGIKVQELASRIRRGDPALYASIQQNGALLSAVWEFKKKLRDFNVGEEFDTNRLTRV